MLCITPVRFAKSIFESLNFIVYVYKYVCVPVFHQVLPLSFISTAVVQLPMIRLCQSAASSKAGCCRWNVYGSITFSNRQVQPARLISTSWATQSSAGM